MQIVEILYEGRDAPLYHGTGAGNAVQILTTNKFEARTFSEILGAYGVSLSRDIRAVEKGFGNVIFVIDQAKLAQRYRIRPTDYWGLSQEPQLVGIGRRKGRYAEAEEFVIGPIEQADQYITTILVAAAILQRIKKDWPEEGAVLLNHPLVVQHK